MTARPKYVRLQQNVDVLPLHPDTTSETIAEFDRDFRAPLSLLKAGGALVREGSFTKWIPEADFLREYAPAPKGVPLSEIPHTIAKSLVELDKLADPAQRFAVVVFEVTR